jgi:hypothetical protein
VPNEQPVRPLSCIDGIEQSRGVNDIGMFLEAVFRSLNVS